MVKKIAVTGAFSYTGKYITQRLLARDYQVITFTGHPDRPDPFNGQVQVFPYNFNDSKTLTSALEGVSILFNTYWVRFNHGESTFDLAVENTKTMIHAAENAGVSRIVHTSITNPSIDSPLPYFRGKAMIEDMIVKSRLSYAILRPTVLFGDEDILINNIAFLLRNFPFFIVMGDGNYRLQPVYVEDFASLAVAAAHQRESRIEDVVGPDIFTFNELVNVIAEKLQIPLKLIHVKPDIALWASRLVGFFMNDVVLTKDEMAGLMAGLLVSRKKPMGKTGLSDWLSMNISNIGRRYASELVRHYK